MKIPRLKLITFNLLKLPGLWSHIRYYYLDTRPLWNTAPTFCCTMITCLNLGPFWEQVLCLPRPVLLA
jgi:hypothetical protein